MIGGLHLYVLIEPNRLADRGYFTPVVGPFPTRHLRVVFQRMPGETPMLHGTRIRGIVNRVMVHRREPMSLEDAWRFDWLSQDGVGPVVLQQLRKFLMRASAEDLECEPLMIEGK